MDTFEKLQAVGAEPSLLLNRLNLSAKTLRLLFAKIRVTESGCWEWVGAKSKGYGVVKIRSIRSTPIQVHRLCYQLVRGEIAESVHLHHQVEDGCMGPACCHPGHLQETDVVEHVMVLSPASIAFIAANRTHCAAGHEYSIESTRVLTNGMRQCRVCDKIRAQQRRDDKRVRPKFKKDPTKFKTHCIRGHALEGENLYTYDSPWGPQTRCRECQRMRNKSAAQK